ncbi:MAG: hypothetical protein Q8Q39_04460 [bacterium]|nr:hypothetical protein [bacterium]
MTISKQTAYHLIRYIPGGSILMLLLGRVALAIDRPSDFGIDVPTSDIDDIGDFYDVVCITTQWIMVFGLIVGVLFVIWGGVKYVTSGGDSSREGDAKKIIINAIIGVVFLVLAVAIVRIIASFFGAFGFSLGSSFCQV